MYEPNSSCAASGARFPRVPVGVKFRVERGDKSPKGTHEHLSVVQHSLHQYTQPIEAGLKTTEKTRPAASLPPDHAVISREIRAICSDPSLLDCDKLLIIPL